MNVEITEKEANQMIKYHTNKIKSFAHFINVCDEKDILKMLGFVRNNANLQLLKKLINEDK